VDGATPMRITPGPLLWFAGRDDGVELGLGDRVLVLPAEAHGLLAALLATEGPFTLDALADAGGLDSPSALAVGRRLVAEGVIAPGRC